MLIRTTSGTRIIPSLQRSVAPGVAVDIEDELAQKLIVEGTFEEDIHPAGNKVLTRNGRHLIAQYQTVTIQCQACMIIYHTDIGEDTRYFQPVVKGDIIQLYAAENFADMFPGVELVEGTELKGWALERDSTPENMVDDEYEVVDTVELYAVYGEIAEPESQDNIAEPGNQDNQNQGGNNSDSGGG